MNPSTPRLYLASTRALHNWIVAVLVAIELILCLMVSWDLRWYIGPEPSRQDQWGMMHIYPVLMFLSLVLQLVCARLWCQWAVDVAEDFRSLGINLRQRPRDLWLWWFVPGLNLVRPYTAMVGLWKTSVGAAHGTCDDAEIPTRPWLTVWWTLWVVHLLALSFLMAAWKLMDLDGLVRGALCFLSLTLAHATLLAAVPLAIALVRQITRNQARAAERAQMLASPPA